MKKILDVLYKVEMIISAAAMSIMVFLTAGNVIARKLFNSSWSFTEELTCALFILITMIGAAMLSRENGHISLDVVTNLLPKSFHKPLVCVAVVAAVAFEVVLVVYGIGMVQMEIATGQTTPALHIKEWIYGLTIPLGGLLLVIHTLEWGIIELMKKEDAQ